MSTTRSDHWYQSVRDSASLSTCLPEKYLFTKPDQTNLPWRYGVCSWYLYTIWFFSIIQYFYINWVYQRGFLFYYTSNQKLEIIVNIPRWDVIKPKTTTRYCNVNVSFHQKFRKLINEIVLFVLRLTLLNLKCTDRIDYSETPSSQRGRHWTSNGNGTAVAFIYL